MWPGLGWDCAWAWQSLVILCTMPSPTEEVPWFPATELCGKLLQRLYPSHLPSTVEEAVLVFRAFFFLVLVLGLGGLWHTPLRPELSGSPLYLFIHLCLGGFELHCPPPTYETTLLT